MDKLVSIIIPTYKGADSILISVNSVIKQSYPNKEIIVVDDNGIGTKSQLETESKLQPYIKNNEIVYLKHATNKNGSTARNTGIKASKGEFIAFLDDDDFWFEDKLKKQIEVFETLDDSYGLVYCGGYNVNKEGCGTVKISEFLQGNILYNFLIGKVDFNSSMFVIRRNVLNDVFGFDESYKRFQDWEFCTRILFKYKGYGMKEFLIAKYRVGRYYPDPDKLSLYCEHHLKKIDYVLSTLGKTKAQKAKARFYRLVALEYFKKGNIKNGFRYLTMEVGILYNSMKLLEFVFEHGIQRVLFRNKKQVESWSEWERKLDT